MFLKSQNGDTLRKLSEGDQSITHVHFAAPFNFRISYDVTEDLNRFLQLFSHETTISTLKLSDLRMNKNQVISLARGIINSLKLQKLVLKKIIRANGGFWYIADSIRKSVSITHVVFEEFKMRPRNFSMITDIILANEHVTTLTIKKCTMFIRCIDSFETYLGNNSSLTSLRLSNVSIDDIILARLLEMINKRNRLTRLEVDHNHITCKDGTLIALMGFNTSITYLNLSHNSIPNEGIVALAGVVNKNKTLRHLNISGNGYIGNIGLLIKNLTANTSLQRLSLARQYFDDDELTALGDLFSRYHQLTRLSLRGSWLHGGRLSLLCKSLRADSCLTRVNLSGVCRNDSTLDSLATWLKTNHSLIHLTLRNNDITSSNISILCSALEVNNTLTYLDLGENYIGRLGAEKLASSITGNHSLIQLKLARNFIGGEGVRIFLFVLRCNANLKKLNIRDNAYCAEGINYAIQLLEENPDLRLTMYDQHLQSLEGIQYLQRALINNPKINQLNYKCKAGKITLLTFGHPGATALSEALFNNHCLTRLTITAGNLGDAGMLQLVDALRENRILEELAFIQCNIHPKGAEILCTWLKMNTRVRKLNLENNGFLSAASEHFADLLCGNGSLIELNIAKCDFKETALHLIFTALKFNTTLRKLDISEYSPLGKEFSSFIGNALCINHTLTHLNICRSFSFLSETSHDVLELQLFYNYSLVYCRYSRYTDNPLEPLIRNRNNKENSLLLLKEYAIIQQLLEDKKSEGGFHLLFRIPKDVFCLILSYIYPAYTQTICNQKYLNYRASYQGMLNPATFFNPHSASDHITDKKKRQKIDTVQMK